MQFEIPVGANGDCYDRYLVRIEEMRQSNRIVRSASTGCRRIPAGHHREPQGRAAVRESMKSHMEELIHHFKLFTEGMHVPPGEATPRSSIRRASSASTSISDGANKPYRVKLRAPDLRAPRRARRDVARAHDRRRRRDHRHAGHRVSDRFDPMIKAPSRRLSYSRALPHVPPVHRADDDCPRSARRLNAAERWLAPGSTSPPLRRPWAGRPKRFKAKVPRDTFRDGIAEDPTRTHGKSS
jgi:hypothetical protein